MGERDQQGERVVPSAPPRRTRRRCVALVVVTAAILTAACQAGTWMGDPDGPKVSVIGDSLVYHAEGNYNSPVKQRLVADELVAEGYRAHVSGFIGETVATGHQQLWPLVATEPGLDTLVIALGTNDAHDGAVPLETSRAILRQWLVEAAGVRCVALVGVNVHAFAWHLDTFGPPFNEMLQEEAARHPNAIFVPWEPDAALQSPTGDVHMPTEEGRTAYRELLVGAVDRCAVTNPPETTTTTTEPETTTTVPDETTTTTAVPDSTTTTTTTTVDEPTTIAG